MSLGSVSTGRLTPPPQRGRRSAAGPRARGPALSRAPWRALASSTSVELWHARGADLSSLPSGGSAVLVEDRPLARRRLRRLALRHGLVLERELVAIPSARAAVVLVDDRPESVRHFWSTVITVPPGLSRSSLPVTLLLALARQAPWTWTGAAAPGRVVIVRKP